MRAMYKCSKRLHCTSDISWLVLYVYGHCSLIVINSGQMYCCVYVKRQNVHCYFVFDCLYGRKVKFRVSLVLCEIFVFDQDVSKKLK